MFRITGGRGFHTEFANGVCVSVQFGGGNYCDNYDMQIGSESRRRSPLESTNAEVAVWKPGGAWITREFFKDDDDVHGYTMAEEVLALLNWAAEQPSEREVPDEMARRDT